MAQKKLKKLKKMLDLNRKKVLHLVVNEREKQRSSNE